MTSPLPTAPPAPSRSEVLSTEELQMLAAMRHGLQTSVLPELRSEMANTICNFSVAFIDNLILRHTEGPALLRRQLHAQGEALAGMATLLAEAAAASAATLEQVRAVAARAVGDPGRTPAELDRTRLDVEGALEAIAPALLGDARLQGASLKPRVNALIRAFIGAIQGIEKASNEAKGARVERHVTLAGSRVAITREQLQDYLRARFPDRGDIAITAFHELPGGSSKSTILLDVRGFEHDGVTPLVIRVDREAGSTDTHVLDEVATLRTVHGLGLPVPEVLWQEDDVSRLGLAFIAVRKIDGTLGGGMWHADPQLCNGETARDLARLLARLHALDTARHGLRGALDSDPAQHPMQGLIDNIRGLWAAKKLEPDGTLETCLCWLERNMPAAPAVPALIHADVSFHNILVKDHRIAGLLDWELSHLGDPIEDLSYARPCIEQLLPWDDFMAEYRAHGGCAYDEDIGRYYGIWRGVRNAVYTLVCGHSFHTDANPDLRWGYFHSCYRLVLLEAAAKVAQACA